MSGVVAGGLEPPTPQASRCIGRCRLGSRAKLVGKMQAGYVESAIYMLVGSGLIGSHQSKCKATSVVSK